MLYSRSLLVTYLISSGGEGNGTPLQYSCLENPMDAGAWWAAVQGVAKSRTRLCDFPFTFPFHALEKEVATHCSVLAWRIPGTGEPGGLPSMGLHRVGHDWSDLAAAAVCMLISVSQFFSPPQLLVTISSFCTSVTLFYFVNTFICTSFFLFLKLLHINDIIWYLSFFVWDTSLSTTFFGSIVL